MGITVCIAAGDHGTADEDFGQWDGKIHVNNPFCDDLAPSCGGTQIDGGQDVVWNDYAVRREHQVAGGWRPVAEFSEGLRRAVIPAARAPADLDRQRKAGPRCAGYRDERDAVFYACGQIREGSSGRLSAVAPLMAALVARLNQAIKKERRLLEPLSVREPGSHARCHLGKERDEGTIKGYQAGPGWAARSGSGTPDGNAIFVGIDGKPATARPSA